MQSRPRDRQAIAVEPSSISRAVDLLTLSTSGGTGQVSSFLTAKECRNIEVEVEIGLGAWRRRGRRRRVERKIERRPPRRRDRGCGRRGRDGRRRRNGKGRSGRLLRL